MYKGNGTAEIFAKTLMCYLFNMVELTTHLKKTSDLDIAFDDHLDDLISL
jgi:hypothetical protein